MGKMTGGEARMALAQAARDGVAAMIHDGTGSPNFQKFINGRPGLNEEDVILPGPILYKFNWLDDVVEYALSFLRARWSVSGPGRGGHFKDSYFILAGGKEIRPEEAPKYEQIIITNDKPYSRKAHIGAKGFLLPRGLFEDCSRAIKREFGVQLLNVKVTFVTLAGGYILRKGKKRTKANGRSGGAEMRYPAVQITVL
jgi:hypothetical protein